MRNYSGNNQPIESTSGVLGNQAIFRSHAATGISDRGTTVILSDRPRET